MRKRGIAVVDEVKILAGILVMEIGCNQRPGINRRRTLQYILGKYALEVVRSRADHLKCLSMLNSTVSRENIHP
jgi:hypothetical protein